jgi:hypothetical protein
VLDGTGNTAKGYTTYPTKGNGGLRDAWTRYIPASPGKSGKDGEDGKNPGQEPDGKDTLTGKNGKEDGDADLLTALTVSPDPVASALTSEITELTDLTDFSGPSQSCPACGTTEDTMFHAVNCLGEDPAA